MNESRITKVVVEWNEKRQAYDIEVTKVFSPEDGGGNWQALSPGSSTNIHNALNHAKESVVITPATNFFKNTLTKIEGKLETI